MKKFSKVLKKTTSYFLTAVVVMSTMICGTVFTVAADSVTCSDDFQSYEIGTSIEKLGAPWTLRKLATGDSVTVQTDSVSGSKALKMEILSTDTNASNNTNFVFDFDDFNTGVYTYSFNFRVETRGANLARMGGLRAGVNGGYNAVNIYTKPSVSTSKFFGESDLELYKMSNPDTQYHKIEIIIDKTNNNYTFKVDGVQKGETTSLSANASSNSITMAQFLMYNQYAGTTRICWIDDIKLEPYEESTLIYRETFETQTEGEFPSDNGWTSVRTYSGDKVSVETDSTTGNKALKFDIAGASSTSEATNINVEFPTITKSGKTLFSFDFRAENSSKKFERLGALLDSQSGGNTSVYMTNWADTLYSYGTVDKVYDMKENDGYVRLSTVVDWLTNTWTVYCNGRKINTGAVKSQGIGIMKFLPMTSTTANGTDSGNGIYWIDNVQVEAYTETSVALEVSDSSGVIESLAGKANEKVTAEITVNEKKSNDYAVIVALKSSTGLENCEVLRASNFTDGVATVDFDLPADVDGNWNIEVFLWDSVSSICPMFEKISLKKN